MLLAQLHHFYLAQAYGRGLYGRGLYSADKPQATVQIGPITLPVTGVGFLALEAALLLAAVTYLFFAYRQRKNSQRSVTITMFIVPIMLVMFAIYLAKIGWSA